MSGRGQEDKDLAASGSRWQRQWQCRLYSTYMPSRLCVSYSVYGREILHPPGMERSAGRPTGRPRRCCGLLNRPRALNKKPAVRRPTVRLSQQTRPGDRRQLPRGVRVVRRHGVAPSTWYSCSLTHCTVWSARYACACCGPTGQLAAARSGRLRNSQCPLSVNAAHTLQTVISCRFHHLLQSPLTAVALLSLRFCAGMLVAVRF